jgi:acylphosphatase
MAQKGYFSAESAILLRYRPRVRRVRVVVSGQVQGVFFRQRTIRLARSEGCAGWVMNRPDGRLEAVFEGPTDAVERLVAWCHEGPERAVVDGVEVREEAPEGLEGFDVRYPE